MGLPLLYSNTDEWRAVLLLSGGRNGLLSRGIALLVLIAFTALPTVSVSATGTMLPYRLEPAMTSSIGYNLAGLAASGSILVWEDRRSGTPDIYAYDLDDAREFRPDPTDGERREPAVSGTTVIWVTGADPAQRRITGVDLARGTPVTVTERPGEVRDPAIDGSLVVWRERRDGVWDIFAYWLDSGREIRITDDPENQAHPSVSGDVVVWQVYRNGNWEIDGWNVRTNRVEPVVTSPDDETDPVVSGDWIAFRRATRKGGPPQLVLRQRLSGEERVIVDDHLVGSVALHGDLLVWEDWRSGLPDIYAYDIAHDVEFAVARSQQAIQPVVTDELIGWISELPSGQGRTQALRIVQRLPTDPQEPPAVPTAERVYFPQTQHYISAGFKAFWQAHGGERIFGYPLTEEFSITDPQTGEKVIVQYFERARFEYRESAPEDQRISLGRLGVELASDRGFQPVPPFESTDERRYFPETGHSLAYGFKEFWETHGGVEIFGYPISEEFVENGRTVQYFERARFEYDPNAEDDEARVLLGLLGREALQRMGWLPRPPIDTTYLTK